MIKTPLWGRRHIIEITGLKKVSLNKNLFRFSLDILNIVPYCKTWSTEVLA